MVNLKNPCGTYLLQYLASTFSFPPYPHNSLLIMVVRDNNFVLMLSSQDLSKTRFHLVIFFLFILSSLLQNHGAPTMLTVLFYACLYKMFTKLLFQLFIFRYKKIPETIGNTLLLLINSYNGE